MGKTVELDGTEYDTGKVYKQENFQLPVDLAGEVGLFCYKQKLDKTNLVRYLLSKHLHDNGIEITVIPLVKNTDSKPAETMTEDEKEKAIRKAEADRKAAYDMEMLPYTREGIKAPRPYKPGKPYIDLIAKLASKSKAK